MDAGIQTIHRIKCDVTTRCSRKYVPLPLTNHHSAADMPGIPPCGNDSMEHLDGRQSQMQLGLYNLLHSITSVNLLARLAALCYSFKDFMVTL
jgi:hypothetical protein